MIITKEDFFEMGFTADENNIGVLENCISRGCLCAAGGG